MTTTKHTHPGLPWPAEFADDQHAIEAEWKVGTLHLHKELAGKSGAFVYLAHVSAEAFTGYAILKLEKREAWHSLPRETKQLENARLNSGTYADLHLPSVLFDYCRDSVNVSLFSIAADGLEYVFPLAKLDAEAGKTISHVASGLAEWNMIGHAASSDPITSRQLLNIWLGYRIHREEGGLLHDFLTKCGATETDAGVTAAGTVYPNPLAFCLADHGTADIYALIGQQHGDCHGNNILLRQEHEKAIPNYYLIDFALYQPSWPVFYDHAYLELSLLLEYGGTFETRRWDSLLTYCGKRPAEADTTLLRPEDTAYTSIVRQLRNSAEKVVTDQHRAIQASVESQQLLGRVAAGLNFANKIGLGLTQRYKALIYAAHQLKDYYRFKHFPLPDAGEALHDPSEVASPTVEANTATWREVWRQCSEFSGEHVYVLIAGPELPRNAENLAALGRLPWSMVLDFDPGTRSTGLLAAAENELTRRRGFHRLTPDQDVGVNFDQATLWLMARGDDERPDTIARDFKAWRYGKVRDIDKHLDKLRKQTSPRQLRVLFLHTDEKERGYIEIIADRIQEVFHQAQIKLIVCHPPSVLSFGDADQYVNIACDPTHWLDGISRYIGADAGINLIYMPRRLQDLETAEIERELYGFRPDELLNVGEDLELVHPGLETDGALQNTGSFLHGNTITWVELSRGYDVQLDMYSVFRNDVVRKLKAYTNETIELGHEPGAGGTTIARRLVWDLHREFPCAVMRKHSDATAARIAHLYRETHLPVLLIIEAGMLTIPERERLFKAVRDEKARAIFVYITRLYNSRAKHQVCSPLSPLESSLFLKKYAQPDRDRMANMEKLAFNDEMLSYRMPFFFGLYAFEENFSHVDAYVCSHVQGLSIQGKMLLRFLALISRFSQTPISQAILAAMAHREDAEMFSIETTLGANAGRLVIHDSHTGQVLVRIIHPLIAEQILRQTGPGGSAETAPWELQLEALSCEFVNALADACGKDAEAALQLLEHMFIQREHWQEDGGARPQFSPLIMSIPSAHGQAHVLEVLTTRFPDEAHFWNHRGRHSNMKLHEDYRKAESFLQHAINLQPSDPLHHHSLGMVYRFEVSRLLHLREKAARLPLPKLTEVRDEIEALYILAEESFAIARRLDTESEHGYVANVQMTFSVIEHMRRLSGETDYAKFFRSNTQSVAWLRVKLEKAKDLLDQVVRLQGQERSSRVSRCAETYRGLLGDYDAMISGLSQLLIGTDEYKPSLRRLIADCIRNHHQDKWSGLTEKNLQRIRDLAMENISAGTATHRDFLNWFHAYRRLPDFDFNRAISTMDIWAANGDPVDAHYYLFILHFTKWHQGLTTDLSRARQHLEVISRNQGGNNWAFEWLATAEGRNACGFVPHNELGEWKLGPDGHKFFNNPVPLLRVVGVVTQIRNARAGSITIYAAEQSGHNRPAKIEAFFVPGTEFITGRDENTLVSAYIGFSYSGLRAWIVKRN